MSIIDPYTCVNYFMSVLFYKFSQPPPPPQQKAHSTVLPMFRMHHAGLRQKWVPILAFVRPVGSNSKQCQYRRSRLHDSRHSGNLKKGSVARGEAEGDRQTFFQSPPPPANWQCILEYGCERCRVHNLKAGSSYCLAAFLIMKL